MITSVGGWRYNYEKFCDFKGQDIYLEGVRSNELRDCIEKCNRHAFDCTHFSFAQNESICFLKYGEKNISAYLVRTDRDCGMLEIKRWPQVF